MAGRAIGNVIFSFIVAVVFAWLFGTIVARQGIKRAGGWPIFVIFFLAVLLASWAASLWLSPLGPRMWGVYWVPILCVGLITAFLMAAMTRRHRPSTPSETAMKEQKTTDTAVTISFLFWLALILLGILIVGGYMRV